MNPATPVQLAGLGRDTASAVLRALEQAGYRNLVTLPTSQRVRLQDDVVPGVVVVGVGAGSDYDPDAIAALFEARAPDVRVVALATRRSQALRAESVMAGASAYLTLPEDHGELRRTVGAVVEVFRAHKESRVVAGLGLRSGADGDLALLSRLGLTLDRLDTELGRHTRRVSHLAAETAAALGYGEPFCAALRYAARVHDLGKLVVPLSTLTAQGELTGAQVAAIRSHARLGANLLAGVGGEQVAFTRELALRHHEWWDGGGYPDGLSGAEVPVSARIVAVADAFDAMTSHRSYRRARSLREAAEELERWSGAQFDPEVVAAFLRVVGGQSAARGCAVERAG